ncbi:lasso peptide biosynthesis PqqD family chaperone [Nonomuraea candida]|uniref:lasso peptide biosynthesis PqqD family chaperone n=1 Tax=Nonomuraea candida TaxID=359159 RepID=UPI0005BC441A|nr:lasso peptide biosynthesis PqqD family chaperone [Nonomuraea candida]
MKLGPGVVTADTEYGLVLLDEGSGRYWRLNETGALVATVLIEGGTPETAARRLADRYGIHRPRAEQDVRALLNALVAAGLATE